MAAFAVTPSEVSVSVPELSVTATVAIPAFSTVEVIPELPAYFVMEAIPELPVPSESPVTAIDIISACSVMITEAIPTCSITATEVIAEFPVFHTCTVMSKSAI